MPLDQVRSDFSSLLDRDDCSADQADHFLRLGLARLQRELRAPVLERVFYVDSTEAFDMLPLPADYLEAIDLFVDGCALSKMTYRLLTKQSVFGRPLYYAR